ncbi:hypothetical protein CC80DRAFT_507847 [Byssothecium circinans]|uniref:Uncharacterized protein n=1 Tax=Byssothecium circinans TaxID=147558 RepID=A0A6A5TJW6_9PLEO|nr:hypothetical protein CC80DRAFT_507847 [Byssothecium circinans]
MADEAHAQGEFYTKEEKTRLNEYIMSKAHWTRIFLGVLKDPQSDAELNRISRVAPGPHCSGEILGEPHKVRLRMLASDYEYLQKVKKKIKIEEGATEPEAIDDASDVPDSDKHSPLDDISLFPENGSYENELAKMVMEGMRKKTDPKTGLQKWTRERVSDEALETTTYMCLQRMATRLREKEENKNFMEQQKQRREGEQRRQAREALEREEERSRKEGEMGENETEID